MHRRMLLACAAGTLTGRGAAAAEPDRVAQARNATIGLIAGQTGGTDAVIAADLARVLDEGDRLRILPIQGSGSAQNIADLMFQKGIDVAIVHTDALTPVPPALRYIANLFQEEVHVLARREIAVLADLAGKPVAVGAAGSDSALTASILFRDLRINAVRQNDSDTVALDRLRLGEVAAMVVVGGDPVPLLRMIDPGTGLHFVPVPLNAALLDTYLPTKLDHRHYPFLVQAGQPVDTVAVGAVLVTLAAPPDSPRAKRVNRFVDALFDRVALLSQPGRHPKWQDVNLAAGVSGMIRYAQAQARLNAPHSTVSLNRQ